VTVIEKAKDVNTLSVEDLVCYLKVHEIGHEIHEILLDPNSIWDPKLDNIIRWTHLESHWIIVQTNKS